MRSSQIIYRQFVEYAKVVCRYYRHAQFRNGDLKLFWQYFYETPYHISKRFKQRVGDNDDHYMYGETPLTTLDTITKELGITSEDHLFELGCGPGRTALWIKSFCQCAVTAIDAVPEFIEKAKRVVRGVSFLNQDVMETDYTNATAIYLYGTCYQDPFIKALSHKLEECQPGTRIATTSYPLTDYNSAFVLDKTITVPFTWGKGDVFIQHRRPL